MPVRSAALRRHFGLSAVLVFAATIAPHTQPALHSVTVAWDRNTDRVTAGYYLHVGLSSGAYTERYDAGSATTFTYQSGVAGQRYYFAVSAYNAAGAESDFSNEVSAVIGRGDYPDHSFEHLAATAAPRSATRPAHAEGLGPVSGLAPLPDGRVLLVESARHVRLIDHDGLSPSLLFSTDAAGTALTEVVAAPDFEGTGVVFVGMTSPELDGSREFRVVRFRFVGHALGEGATIVGGLSFRGEHPPRFDIDGTGHVFVAMPGTDAARGDAYAARLLRFAPDGSVPEGQPAFSPVIASSLPIPLDLDMAGSAVWMVGVDERGQPVLGNQRLASDQSEWPARIVAAPLAERLGLGVAAYDVSRGPGSAQRAVLLDTDGGLYSFVSLDAADDVRSVPWSGDTPVDVALAHDGTVFVVVKSAAGRFSVFQIPVEQ